MLETYAALLILCVHDIVTVRLWATTQASMLFNSSPYNLDAYQTLSLTKLFRDHHPQPVTGCIHILSLALVTISSELQVRLIQASCT